MYAKRLTVSKTVTLMTSAAMALCLFASPVLADGLSDAMKSAYETNPRIKAERKALEATDEGVAQAISGWRPTVGAQYDRGKQRNSVDGSDWDSSKKESRGLTVTQPIFSGGGTIARTESADQLVLAGRESLRNTEQNVLLDAATAYMDVVRDMSVMDLSKNNVNVLEKQLGASRDRFNVGEVTRTDVAQSEARLARAQSDAAQAEGNLESSRATFERVIGYKAESVAKPESFPTLPATQEEAIQIGMKNNPALLNAKYRQSAADSDIDIALSSLLPTVSLQGQMNRSEGAGFTGDTDIDTDSLTVNLSVPLYQSGSEYSRVREAKSTSSQRTFDLSNATDQTRQQVIQAWEGYQTALATIKANQATITAAEIALDGVKQEELYGSRTILDVLDAEQELFVSRVNLVRSERDRVVAIYSLLAATGQLSIQTLDLKTKAYNPEEHYDDVKYQFIGF